MIALIISSLLATYAYGSSVQEAVTCGAVIKLKNKDTKFHLHSHPIAWGSGSGQQSVTANEATSDPNSLWIVKEAHNSPLCEIGTELKCGDKFRLEHVSTKHNLHSHLFTSPLTKQQEVSGFGENGKGDTGDNWEIVCSKPNQIYWERGSDVQLRHVDTNKFLHTTPTAKFDKQNCGGNCPIMGQLEVSTTGKRGDSKNVWFTDQGIYFPSANARATIDREIDDEL